MTKRDKETQVAWEADKPRGQRRRSEGSEVEIREAEVRAEAKVASRIVTRAER